MYPPTQLVNDLYQERLARAEQQHELQRLRALDRATRRVERAERRMRRAERRVRRLCTQADSC
jgi:hypothetical protein